MVSYHPWVIIDQIYSNFDARNLRQKSPVRHVLSCSSDVVRVQTACGLLEAISWIPMFADSYSWIVLPAKFAHLIGPLTPTLSSGCGCVITCQLFTCQCSTWVRDNGHMARVSRIDWNKSGVDAACWIIIWLNVMSGVRVDAPRQPRRPMIRTRKNLCEGCSRNKWRKLTLASTINSNS